MAERTTPRSLIQGIASAQQEIEGRQILNLGAVFDPTPRPLMMSRGLPSLRHGVDPAAEDLVDIPLLTLLPHNPLRISEAQVEFDIRPGGVEEGGEWASRTFPNLQKTVSCVSCVSSDYSVRSAGA